MSIFALNAKIKKCKLCEGLNLEASGDIEATLNAPGYGDTKAKVVIIGQSLCGDPCINSQVPFTDGCGILLDEAFEKAGIRKDQLYITNVVKCHPPKNRASKANEKSNCRGYLENELTYLAPKEIICLGGDARDHFDKNTKLETNKEMLFNGVMTQFHFLYHPSYIQNRCPSQKERQYIDLLASLIKRNYA